MTPKEQRRFDTQYQRHLRALKLQGLSNRTMDSYTRAVRRLSAQFDACPAKVSIDQLGQYFVDLRLWLKSIGEKFSRRCFLISVSD